MRKRELVEILFVLVVGRASLLLLETLHGGHAFHQLCPIQHIGVGEHAVFQRHDDELNTRKQKCLSK